MGLTLQFLDHGLPLYGLTWSLLHEAVQWGDEAYLAALLELPQVRKFVAHHHRLDGMLPPTWLTPAILSPGRVHSLLAPHYSPENRRSLVVPEGFSWPWRTIDER